MKPYHVSHDGSTITCLTCGHASQLDFDVYFRFCGPCDSMLGATIRQRWSDPIARTELIKYCAAFGRYKKIIEMGTGIAYKVPTERILTEGIKGDQLAEFPRWTADDD